MTWPNGFLLCQLLKVNFKSAEKSLNIWIEQVFLSDGQKCFELFLCLGFNIIQSLVLGDGDADLVSTAQAVKVRLPPLELFGVHLASGLDEMDTTPERIQTLSVSDGDLHASAFLVGMF